MTEEPVGRITHYFPNIAVAAARLSAELKVGDRVRVKGHTTDFTEAIESLEIEHQKVDRAGPGDDVAFKVSEKARPGDQLLRL
ncbi:MAG: translation elongation factor-like protein [Chloroflexi bacterium]|nr:MAG: translation elongation factor-like protein [Chloroflexota bacterium]